MKLMGLAVVTFLLLAVASGCGSGSSKSVPPVPAGPTLAPVAVPTADATHVKDIVRSITGSDGSPMLIDSEGHTLYVFRDDAVTSSGVSKCTMKCLETWHPLMVNYAAVVLLAPLNLQLGVFKRADDEPASEQRQVMYKGKPLYLYAGDTNPGEVNGASIDGWSVAGP